jgi:hypothetical protein
MALNENLIYKYNFSSDSNVNWNFELQFLRGKNAEVGTFASGLISDGAFEKSITVVNSYDDDLPLGMPQTRVLKLKLVLNGFVGDYLELKDWILTGGQIISNEFYPNQWRLLSNNGRGATDVNYNIVEFWGAQQFTPITKYEGTFGNENLTIELNVPSIDKFLFNKSLNLFGLYLIVLNSSEFLEFIDIDTVYQFRKTGTNSSSQSVDVLVATDYQKQTAQFHTIEDINYALNLYTDIQSATYLRSWLNKNTSADTNRLIFFDNLISKHWTFYKQRNTLSKVEGDELLKADELINVFIKDTSNNIIGGLFSGKSKNGANQFITIYDFLKSIGESFVNKYIFSFLDLDNTLTLPYFAIINQPIYDDYTQINVDKSIDLNHIISYEILDKNYLVNYAKSSFYAIGDNQKSVQINNNLTLIEDSHELKSLITTSLQMPDVDDKLYNNQSYYKNNEMPINQIYYNYLSSDAILVHTKTKLNLGDSLELTSSENSTGNFDFASVSNSGQRWSNWRDIVVYANSMNNAGGLNYMQCLGINNIYNPNAKYTKLSVIDYKLRQQNLGGVVTFDFNNLSSYLPNEFYKSNKNIIVSCETNYINGISEVVLYTKG